MSAGKYILGGGLKGKYSIKLLLGLPQLKLLTQILHAAGCSRVQIGKEL